MSAANFTDTAPTTSAQHIVYDAVSGTLSYDRDGSGSSYDAIAFARLIPGTVLDYDDFMIL